MCKAFSLLELLIVIAILAILSLLSLPTINHLINRNQINNTTEQIVSALNYARSEAIKNDNIVIFCKSKTHRQCDGNWNDGQIVSLNGKILRIYSALPANETLLWKSNFGNNDFLEFQGTGSTYGQDGSFILCTKDHHYGKRIVVIQSGRIRIDANVPKNCL